MENKSNASVDEFAIDLVGDYDVVDDTTIADEYEQVFRYLHTLSSEYKNILVDYYIGEMPIKILAEKYNLPETTIKWRLNVSRQKVRDRIGEDKMDKVYKRINWVTTTCNGSMDPNRYLSNQVARAICEAAYEKPLTVEEISLKTGLPTMYIEDALPNLIYGDAIEQVGKKYVTDFIILRHKDKSQMEKGFAPIVSDVANYFEKLFNDYSRNIAAMSFYGHDFGMNKLGYIALPLALREKIRNIKTVCRILKTEHIRHERMAVTGGLSYRKLRMKMIMPVSTCPGAMQQMKKMVLSIVIILSSISITISIIMVVQDGFLKIRYPRNVKTGSFRRLAL